VVQPGRDDEWRGFGRWEPHHALDAKDLRFDVFRGAEWRFAEVGKTWVAVTEAAWLIALVAIGFVLQAPGALIVVFLAGGAFSLWAQASVEDWADAHNARVADAQRRLPPS
jgi:hypothetical protein